MLTYDLKKTIEKKVEIGWIPIEQIYFDSNCLKIFNWEKDENFTEIWQLVLQYFIKFSPIWARRLRHVFEPVEFNPYREHRKNRAIDSKLQFLTRWILFAQICWPERKYIPYIISCFELKKSIDIFGFLSLPEQSVELLMFLRNYPGSFLLTLFLFQTNDIVIVFFSQQPDKFF